MKTLTIIIPFYNEEEVLSHLYERLCHVLVVPGYAFEFLFVNDGSTDDSLCLVKKFASEDSRVSYIDLSRNFGKEIAMSAGFQYATGDAAVVIDADLQDPPELIPQMIEYWERGYDDVYAQRISRKGESGLKKLTSFLFYRVLEKMSSVPIQKDTGDYRLLSRKALDALNRFGETQRYTKGLFSLIGFNKISIKYEREPRYAGKTKWNYFKLMNLAIEGITSFSTAPLRIANVMGMIVSLTSLIYMLYVFIMSLLYGNPVDGYPSMLIIILFLGGLQLMSLGIIGEYLGRVFNESKNRPLFFVNEYKKGDN